ncbi:MAG: cupin domain-containing protein [Acidimicrobiales bacterium]|jgi:uncharacterized cupin superfamily protein
MTDTEATNLGSPVGTPKIAGAATRTDLEDWGPLAEATGHEMSTAGITLWKNEETEAESGIWECTPGPSRWDLETNEFVHVLAGRMTVTEDGAEPVELSAGDSVVFPLGWNGTWDIHETLRKLYVIF